MQAPGSLVVVSVSVSPNEQRLVDPRSFLVVYLTILAPTLISPPLLQDSPELYQMLGCGSASASHQLWDEASVMTTGLSTNLCVEQNIVRQHYINSFPSNHIWFSCRSLGHLEVHVSCYSRQCQGWLYSHVMGLGLDWPLLDYSVKLWTPSAQHIP